MIKEDLLQSLNALFPRGYVFTDAASLISYEVDAGLDRGMPEGVVFPRNAGDVARLVRWAAEHGVPLIARGAGTGLSGGAVAERGGIIVEFSRMNAVLEIDEYGRSVVVEPGLINLRLDEQVKARGWYFPPDPASQRSSTIGGNVAENSGGPHCFKYGVTTNYISGMDVVLADGRAVRIGGRALDYPTYDLCGLITGSEGMFAIMTAIFARLVRNPPAVKTMLVVFESVEQAGVAVSAVIAAGLVPATMEMMDQKIVEIIEPFAHANMPLDAGAVLIIEVDGYPTSLDAQIAEITHIMEAKGGRDMRVARDEEERAAIWLARKSAAGAVSRLTPAYYTVDITVPRSYLSQMLGEVNGICGRHGLRVGYIFHAGDGNLHPLILIPNPEDPQLMQRVHRAGLEIVLACVQKNGSLSGEHGIGIEKRQYMALMHTVEELAAMQDIKRVFDPANILNPGKVFPAPEAVEKAPEASQEVAGDIAQLDTENNIFAPESAAQAAQSLAAFAVAGKRVTIRATSSATLPGNADVLCSAAKLRSITTFAPDDLYITVGAGMPLVEIQSFLAEQGKWLPLASPWSDTTIGGLISTNLNAPLRMRYGSIRDLVLCATVALADGRVIRTGRPVVKNVAGYDLTKAFIGAHGTLGMLADVTLKIAAPPRARRTLLVPVDDHRRGLLWARAVLPIALVASAITLSSNAAAASELDSPYMLTYTAEGLLEDVQAELEQVRAALREADAPTPIEVESPSGTDRWTALLNDAGKTLKLRVGIPPKDVAAYVNDRAELLCKSAFLVDVAAGHIYASITQDDASAAQERIEQLRRPALALDGYAIVIDMPAIWERTIDQWGYSPSTLDLMLELKTKWDRQSILNVGEFIL
jgi:glycolate oxidase subunit GlcD